MQGTLAEIDIRSILELIKIGQRTGGLYVEAYPKEDFSPTISPGPQENLSPPPYWFVFFVNGKIVYTADQPSSSLLRLQNHLQRYKLEDCLSSVKKIQIATVNDAEYAYLWLLLEKKILTPEQARHIVENMIQETLFELLSVHQGSFIFEVGEPLAPQLVSLEVSILIKDILQKIQQWKSFYPILSSPDQSFIITNPVKLKTKLSPIAYQKLSHWADGKTSLKKIACYLDKDFLSLAKVIYPYVERGWIDMVNEKKVHKLNTNHTVKQVVPHILCIDEDKEVQLEVKEMLEGQKYQVTTMRDPLDALSKIFTYKPDLIICGDIWASDLDGYQLCAMLRHSYAFKKTPIIMLTSKENFMDRVRAQMVGITGYLTKPLGDNELIYMIRKYLKWEK